jgi:hypothetical protein
MKKNGFAVLKARIEKELKDIKKVVERADENLAGIAIATPNDLIVGGFANYVHGFYNGLEKIFNLIAESIDNFEPPDAAWHKELLKQMTLEIQGIRPAVPSADLAAVLEDYLEFRHFFRHSYSFDLDWDELKPKVENLKSTFDKLEKALQQFFLYLDAAREQLE